MRRTLALIVVVLVAAASTQALAAGKRRIKWVKSVYADAKGVGLKYPEGVACTADRLVVADTGNSRLLSYTYRDDVVTADGIFPVPKSSPIKIELNSRGDLYFLDGRERQVVIVGADGGPAEGLKLSGAPSKSQIVPKSFAIDEDDLLYVLDIFSRYVLVFDAGGAYLRRVPFPDDSGFLTDLTVDSRGKIFLVDPVNAVVYAAAPGEARFSALTVSLKEFMNYPTRISVDLGGTIYLVDQHGSGLALVGPDGAFLGRRLAMGWNEGSLYYPAQLCISPGGNLFVADRNNNRVQIFRAGRSEVAADSEESER